MFLSSPLVLRSMKTSVSLVLSRCQKRQSRLIFSPYSRLTMRPSSTPPHPYWPAQLNPFNVPLGSDTFPTAELPTITSLSFCFLGVKSMPETTERVDDSSLPSHQRTSKTPSWTPPPLFSSLLSSCNISPTLGTTDSSLPISQSFEGLGLGLPSTPTCESLADKATNEDSPLIDVVYPQANASVNTERANPRLPSELASELVSFDDHSGSSYITLFNSIGSDQVERTASVEEAAVAALSLDSFKFGLVSRDYFRKLNLIDCEGNKYCNFYSLVRRPCCNMMRGIFLSGCGWTGRFQTSYVKKIRILFSQKIEELEE